MQPADPVYYRSANKLWVDYLLLGSSTRQTAIRVLAFALLPYFVGLGLAVLGGFASTYLRTPAIYYGLLGIILTLSALLHGSATQYAMYRKFFACFAMEPKSQLEDTKITLATYSSFSKHLRAFLISSAASLIIVYAGLFWFAAIAPYTHALHLTLPRLAAFDQHGWYDHVDAVYSFIILSVFALFVCAPLATAGSVMLRMPLLLLRSSKWTPAVPPLLVKAHFAPLTSFYTRTSLAWSGGAILIGLLLLPNSDWLSVLIVVFIFLLGIVNFFLPQVVYERVVTKSEAVYVDMMSALLHSVPSGRPNELDAESQFAMLAKLDPVTSLLTRDRWVYPLHQTYLVLASYLLSLLGWDQITKIIEAGQ